MHAQNAGITSQLQTRELHLNNSRAEEVDGKRVFESRLAELTAEHKASNEVTRRQVDKFNDGMQRHAQQVESHYEEQAYEFEDELSDRVQRQEEKAYEDLAQDVDREFSSHKNKEDTLRSSLRLGSEQLQLANSEK